MEFGQWKNRGKLRRYSRREAKFLKAVPEKAVQVLPAKEESRRADKTKGTWSQAVCRS